MDGYIHKTRGQLRGRGLAKCQFYFINLKKKKYPWRGKVGCFICVKMWKVQYPQWYSHYLTLFDDGITKILKIIWCWRVEHQGFVLCICRIKQTSPKNKFQRKSFLQCFKWPGLSIHFISMNQNLNQKFVKNFITRRLAFTKASKLPKMVFWGLHNS